MDNIKFINTDTWEIIDEPNNLIHVDKDIAETILLLNKKGYRTKASCSGHPNIEYVQFADSKEKLKDYYNAILLDNIKDDKRVFFYKLIEDIETYVLFDSVYKFDSLPDGFEYYEYDDSCKINCFTKIHDDDMNFYDYETLRDKILEVNENLLDWVKELKSL